MVKVLVISPIRATATCLCITGVDYDAKTETTAIFKVRLHTTKDKGE
jgi:hypothetical protein